MNLKDFKNNCLSQKDVITRTDLISGGMHGEGTQTSNTTQTSTITGWASVIYAIAAHDTPPTIDDHSGDWDDEGTCDE